VRRRASSLGRDARGSCAGATLGYVSNDIQLGQVK
jgi:hypothetical protein